MLSVKNFMCSVQLLSLYFEMGVCLLPIYKFFYFWRDIVHTKLMNIYDVFLYIVYLNVMEYIVHE